MEKLLLTLAVLGFFETQAQDSTANTLILSGYVETYYNYDFNAPTNHERPSFLYNHNRHNEFNINLAFVKAAYNAQNVRGNVALMVGTYANANLAAETGVLKNIYEANVGLRLSSRLWLDVGIMPSHIGFESAVSKDCWTLTRGILAENSPYYETGAKLTFSPNDKWTLTALILNGWQRIRRVDGNNTPAFGTQITYKPNDKATLNYSTFVGSDKPDATRKMRIFHNFYGIFEVTDRFGLTIGFDIGTEQTVKNSSKVSTWYTPIVVAKYILSEKWTIAGRFENYTDKSGVIIAPDFQVNGYSVNLDYAPLSNALLRVEGRLLQSPNAIFTKGQTTTANNFFITSSLAVSF